MTIIIESRFLVYHSSSVGYNNRVNAFEHLIEILITISGAYYFLLECTKEEIRAIPNKYTTILDFQSATGDIFSVVSSFSNEDLLISSAGFSQVSLRENTLFTCQRVVQYSS